MEELKINNCPNCGARGQLKSKGRGRYYVECAGDCWLVTGKHSTKSAAVDEWNRLKAIEDKRTAAMYAIDDGPDVYINRKEAIKHLCLDYEGAAEMLKEIPPADVVPVVHGRWGASDICGSMLCRCSVCGFNLGAYTYRFCPR